MILPLFILMVAVFAVLLLASAIIAHAPIGRHTAGWWTGIVAAIILLAASLDQFQDLPTRTASDGCTTSVVTDWDRVAADAVHLNWIGIGSGLILALLAIELLSRLELSQKVLAFVLLLVSFSCTFLLVYVFAIRKLSGLIFNLAMGGLAGSLVHMAFFSGRFWSQMRHRMESIDWKEMWH